MSSETKYIYKILPSSPPPPSPLPLALPVSPLDERDQYIHASLSLQILRTLNAFFTPPAYTAEKVYILRIPFERVEKVVRWESSKGVPADRQCWDAGVEGGAGLFPHLYNGLKLGSEEVESVGEWARRDGGWNVEDWPFGDVDRPAAA
jgi:uncharacterized protein (DUF952 family)